MNSSEWDKYCEDHGGGEKMYSNQELGIIYFIEVFEAGEWGMHCTAGTIQWAQSKANRLKDADDWRVTMYRVH